MKALIVDVSSRRLEVFAGSVTRIPGYDGGDQKIVIRHGATLGSAEDVFGKTDTAYNDNELALVVTGIPYQAESSTGYTEVFSVGSSVTVVGVCGCFGVNGLRPIQPMPAYVYAPGKWSLFRCNTHQNKNVETAVAARKGLAFLSKARGLLVVAEGQSNTTNAFVVGGRPDWDDRSSRAKTVAGLRGAGECDLDGNEASGRMISTENWSSVPAEHTQWLVEKFLPTTAVSAVA